MGADDADDLSKTRDKDGNDTEESIDCDEFLSDVGFDAERTFLTRRQAEILVMREREFTQATIADRIGTTRENVAGIESRARDNVEKARETVEFAELLTAPARVELPAGTDLYDAPELVFEACDDAGVKVPHNAPELMKQISDAERSAIDGRQVRAPLVVSVTSDGTVRVRKA